MIAKLARCRGAVALAHVARQADILSISAESLAGAPRNGASATSDLRTSISRKSSRRERIERAGPRSLTLLTESRSDLIDAVVAYRQVIWG